MPSESKPVRAERFPASVAIGKLSPIVGARVARDLLNRFGDLRRIADASTAQLTEINGFGMAGAKRLKAAFELAAAKTMEERLKPVFIHDSFDLAKVVLDRLRHLEVEQVRVVLANESKRYLGDFEVATGSKTTVLVDESEVFRIAIEFGAGVIYLAHNHPSGSPEPSEQDVKRSLEIQQAGRIMGIPLIDHVIIGERCSKYPEGYASLWDTGDLKI